jgi:hypothetical protein
VLPAPAGDPTTVLTVQRWAASSRRFSILALLAILANMAQAYRSDIGPRAQLRFCASSVHLLMLLILMLLTLGRCGSPTVPGRDTEDVIVSGRCEDCARLGLKLSGAAERRRLQPCASLGLGAVPSSALTSEGPVRHDPPDIAR